MFHLQKILRLHSICTSSGLSSALKNECASTPSLSMLQVRTAIKAAAADVISRQYEQGVPLFELSVLQSPLRGKSEAPEYIFDDPLLHKMGTFIYTVVACVPRIVMIHA